MRGPRNNRLVSEPMKNPSDDACLASGRCPPPHSGWRTDALALPQLSVSGDTMSGTVLSPAEAVVLLQPNVANGLKAIKVTMLQMLSQGLLKLELRDRPGL